MHVAGGHQGEERCLRGKTLAQADPTFEGLDDLPAVLTDLKRKRDALQGKLDSTESAAPPTLTPQQLRDWANEQFDKLERMADKEEVDLADRQLVEAFVQRIEIDPDARTGVVVLHADLHSVLASTRLPGGDSRGSCVERVKLRCEKGRIVQLGEAS
jgi:hypothetical protein